MEKQLRLDPITGLGCAPAFAPPAFAIIVGEVVWRKKAAVSVTWFALIGGRAAAGKRLYGANL